MFNFLDPKLLPKITNKPSSTEKYEADNLLSNVYSDKSRGFIAFPSLKPPVEIEFELLCNVNISYIFLNTSVGTQRCSGVEVFVKNSNSQYVSIGRATYDTQGVIFCNSRKYSQSEPPPCFNSNFALYFFKSGTFKSFFNASRVKLVIFRTEKSVPCLASVEIWGAPSKSCSVKTVETINRLTRTITESSTEPNTSSEPVVNKNQFEIPDDFKDDLTYNLMTIPYTLPSGKTVDQTTLEKHIESEKSFGRKPCDPFTGIKFTEGLKPVLNVGLKSRIDMFLLEHSHREETFGLKRSLRAENIRNKRIKKCINDSLEENDINYSNDLDSEHSDLDDLIQKAKSQSNFISFTDSIESVQNICLLCKNTFDYLYELPCGHNYCRTCLLEICKSCACGKCKMSFVRSDVRRIDV